MDISIPKLFTHSKHCHLSPSISRKFNLWKMWKKKAIADGTMWQVLNIGEHLPLCVYNDEASSKKWLVGAGAATRAESRIAH